MTNARSSPAVVGAGDPESLIVAGGYAENTVEVLREEQWSLVEEPIPRKFYYGAVCAIHRDVFFVADKKSDTRPLYYCYLNSLLSAATTEPKTKLWKSIAMENNYLEPIEPCGLASFHGYLVVWCSHYAYAYSPLTQSWVCVGDLPFDYYVVSCLHTVMIGGKLVIMDNWGMAVRASLRGTYVLAI